MALPTITPYEMPSEAELPGYRVGWFPDVSRAALLIHDMQQYFVDAFPAGRPPVTDLVGNIQKLRTAAVSLGMPVIYTAQPGRMPRAQRGLLHDFWGPGMSTDPRNKEIIPALAPQPWDPVVTKWRYSAFHGTTLANILHAHRSNQLIVCGVYAHVGCLMTANDAFTRDIETFLVADAVADFSRPKHRMSLDYAAQCCAVPMSTRAVVAALARPGEPGGRDRDTGREPARTPEGMRAR